MAQKKRGLERLIHDPGTRLRVAFGSLCGLLLVGAVGYHLIEPDFSLFDGFYMTLITVSTVGFGEVQTLSPAGRVFTSGLIMLGMVLVAFAVGSFLETVVEGELAELLGRRRVVREIKGLKDHWIICGFGRMGAYVAHDMTVSKRKPPFVIVERSDERVAAARELGYLAYQGDATLDETMHEVGIDRAAGLVSLVATDAENVFICLTASQLNLELRIVARALDEASEAKLLRAGASKVIAPYYVGGLRLSQAVLRPAVQDFIEFATGRGLDIDLEEITVHEGSLLVGVALRASPIRQDLNLILVAVKRPDASMIFNPGPDHVILAGDTLIAVGEGENLQALEGRCQA